MAVAMGTKLIVFIFVVSLGTHSIDPTPQIRALEKAQADRFIMYAVAGFLLFVTAALWIMIRWLTRRLSRKPTT